MLAEENVPNTLKRFYMYVRNEKGESYKLNSMRSLRSSLQRYFLKLYNVDIINDGLFIECNTVYENVLKKIKSDKPSQ